LSLGCFCCSLLYNSLWVFFLFFFFGVTVIEIIIGYWKLLICWIFTMERTSCWHFMQQQVNFNLSQGIYAGFEFKSYCLWYLLLFEVFFFSHNASETSS
jgi:hypothetical protein